MTAAVKRLDCVALDDLQIPLLSEASRGKYPADGRCPSCDSDFSDGVAYLSGGGLLLSKDGQNSLHLDRLKGFLHVGFHGKSQEARDCGDLMLVDHVSGGQFDLSWCSIRCMRASLMQLLDQLEASIGRDDKGA